MIQISEPITAGEWAAGLEEAKQLLAAERAREAAALTARLATAVPGSFKILVYGMD